jgi:RNA polymerase sigma factor (sigma-70 family)
MTGLAVDQTRTLGAIVARAAAGDEEAFAAIVGAYQQDMVRVAFGICGDADVARDAVQAALVVAWRKLGTVREPERLRSWLVAVAANEARQLVRRRHHVRLDELAVEPTADSSAEPAAAISRVDLDDALRRLSADERTVIALRYGAGFDSEEIGRILGVSASGVRSRLARLMDRLRKDLGDA